MDKYDITILQVTTYDGIDYDGGEALEHLSDADQVFYSLQIHGGEEFFRWIAGPFEDLEQLESAIEEEQETYSEAS